MKIKILVLQKKENIFFIKNLIIKKKKKKKKQIKVKSQNANGIIDRKDGLPGYLDQDDYKLYYYDINEEGGELNFERPLKIHKHTGRENTLKRTFRNEPGYENTKGKFYRTGSMPDMTSNIQDFQNDNTNNGTNKLKIINDKNDKNNTLKDESINNNKNDISKTNNSEENQLNKKDNKKEKEEEKVLDEDGEEYTF